MKTFTIEDIRALEPCYYPARYLPEDWSGTALDILRMDTLPTEYRSWVVLRSGFIDDKTKRLFAVWCARRALSLVENPDPRSIAACDIAERYAQGQAFQGESRAAVDAACAAYKSASDTARLAQINHLIEMLEAEYGHD